MSTATGKRCLGPGRIFLRVPKVHSLQFSPSGNGRGCQAPRRRHTLEGVWQSSHLYQTESPIGSKLVTLLTKDTRRGQRCSGVAGPVRAAVPAYPRPNPHAPLARLPLFPPARLLPTTLSPHLSLQSDRRRDLIRDMEWSHSDTEGSDIVRVT